VNVLISGSSSGIGRATAKAFAATGDRVFAGMRCPDDAKPIPDAEVIPLDVNDPSSVTRAVAITTDTAGTIDVLINNAGVAACASIEATDNEIFRTILETNLLGVHRLTREVLSHRRAKLLADDPGALRQRRRRQGRRAVPLGFASRNRGKRRRLRGRRCPGTSIAGSHAAWYLREPRSRARVAPHATASSGHLSVVDGSRAWAAAYRVRSDRR
jgi:NAD(P)-dependent dehydrogenase (short-subunit alcohol dehydrogenase family)